MGRDFENRKHAMMKRGARDAKLFTRAGRQISMAVKAGGPEPDANPALRRAIENARAVNMPKDKIQGAIEKAAGLNDQSEYQNILYEGYGPHGVAVMVETTTDNPTRTVANIRSIFKKANGNMGTSGSVAFMFDQFGVFRLSPEGLDRDTLELELIDHGLEEIVEGATDEGAPLLVLRCSRASFGALQAALEARKVEVTSSGFEWIPKNTTSLSPEQLEELDTLFERLEADDDVTEVFSNLG